MGSKLNIVTGDKVQFISSYNPDQVNEYLTNTGDITVLFDELGDNSFLNGEIPANISEIYVGLKHIAGGHGFRDPVIRQWYENNKEWFEENKDRIQTLLDNYDPSNPGQPINPDDPNPDQPTVEVPIVESTTYIGIGNSVSFEKNDENSYILNSSISLTFDEFKVHFVGETATLSHSKNEEIVYPVSEDNVALKEVKVDRIILTNAFSTKEKFSYAVLLKKETDNLTTLINNLTDYTEYTFSNVDFNLMKNGNRKELLSIDHQILDIIPQALKDNEKLQFVLVIKTDNYIRYFYGPTIVWRFPVWGFTQPDMTPSEQNYASSEVFLKDKLVLELVSSELEYHCIMIPRDVENVRILLDSSDVRATFKKQNSLVKYTFTGEKEIYYNVYISPRRYIGTVKWMIEYNK